MKRSHNVVARHEPYTGGMDAESWLASELASFDCAACGQPYGQGHVRLIAQREELFFVDLSCEHCGSQAVAIVTIQIDGETATLEGGELVRTRSDRHDPGEDDAFDGPPISVDDVLDVHLALEDFEGDVDELIAWLGGNAR